MTDLATRLGLGGPVRTEELVEFLRDRRWYASRARDVASVDLVDVVALPGEERLYLVLLTLGFETGASEIYQLVVGVAAQSTERDEIATVDGSVLYEASSSPELARLLVSAPQWGTRVMGSDGDIELRRIGPSPDGAGDADVQPLGVEQSNTSLVVGGSRLVKMYRRIEAGLHPELEMLLFLTERAFPNVPLATGWYSYAGAHLRATLGVAQQFLPDARDGWSLGLDEVPMAADSFLARLGRLGEVVGAMHCVLASDNDDPAFAPELPTPASAGFLTATIEDQIDDAYARLPESDATASIAGRADELRGMTRSLVPVLQQGRLIRTHGDLHLGQVLWADGDWFVTDFEGEPDRSVADRRQKSIALRDVAGMLRSFSYLAATVERAGLVLPDDFESRARREFLGAYLGAVEGAQLVPGEGVQERILDLFELEKVLYELRYELAHRPDWVDVPITGLRRFFERISS